MGLFHCSAEDRRIIGEALKAVVDGPFFSNEELAHRFGGSRPQIEAILQSWPTVDERQPRVRRVVSAALHELRLSWDRVPRATWDYYLSAAPYALSDVSSRWRLRPYTQEPCPICGFVLDFEPWPDDQPSYGICPCCGVQFGYHDFARDPIERAVRHGRLRRDWIRRGMPWHSRIDRLPPNWDPIAQLERINGRG